MTEKLNVMRIIWASLVVSTFMYLVVLYVVQSDPGYVPQVPPPLLPLALGGVAIAVAITSFILPRMVAKKALLELRLPVVEVPPAERMFSDRKGRTRSFEQPAQARQRAVAGLQTAFILGMALSEAIALFGFVVLFLGASLPVGLPFFALGWVLMALRFPTASALDRQLEAAYDADLAAPPRELQR